MNEVYKSMCLPTLFYTKTSAEDYLRDMEKAPIGKENPATNVIFCKFLKLCDDIFVPPFRVLFSKPFFVCNLSHNCHMFCLKQKYCENVTHYHKICILFSCVQC